MPRTQLWMWAADSVRRNSAISLFSIGARPVSYTHLQVAAGSTVVMYISRPQVATTTKVPSLTGMSTADARTLLVQNLSLIHI